MLPTDDMRHPREELVVTCIMDNCQFKGTVEQLWSHTSDNHHERVLYLENLWQSVLLPYGTELMCKTKRFLLYSPFGIYIISLSLTSEPLILLVSIRGLDAHWRDFEIEFHSASNMFTRKLTARIFKHHYSGTVFHEVDTSRVLAESLPIINIKVNWDNLPV